MFLYLETVEKSENFTLQPISSKSVSKLHPRNNASDIQTGLETVDEVSSV